MLTVKISPGNFSVWDGKRLLFNRDVDEEVEIKRAKTHKVVGGVRWEKKRWHWECKHLRVSAQIQTYGKKSVLFILVNDSYRNVASGTLTALRKKFAERVVDLDMWIDHNPKTDLLRKMFNE